MSTEVIVQELPKCAFCKEDAAYDGKTVYGPWAYMCNEHWTEQGIGKLGTGLGQRLVLEKLDVVGYAGEEWISNELDFNEEDASEEEVLDIRDRLFSELAVEFQIAKAPDDAKEICDCTCHNYRLDHDHCSYCV